MAVKQTQFAYDEEWADRKRKTGKTWKEIMELGIISAEEELGVKYVGKDDPETTPDVAPEEEPVEADDEIPMGEFRLIITPPKNVEEREFDIYDDEMWQTVNAFSDIEEGEIFRIRDDGKVIECNGTKCFSYEGFPYKDERGRKCADVKARAII